MKMKPRYIVKRFGPTRRFDYKIRLNRKRRYSSSRNYNRFNNKRFIRIRNRALNRKRKNITEEDLDKELDKYQEKAEIERQKKENENNDNKKEENQGNQNQIKVDNP